MPRRNYTPQSKLSQLWDYLRGVSQPVDPAGDVQEPVNPFPGAQPQVIENPYYEGPEPEQYELPTGEQYFGRGYGYEYPAETAQRLMDAQAGAAANKQRLQALGQIAVDDTDPRAQQAGDLLGLGIQGPRRAAPADFSSMLLGMHTQFDPEPLTPEGMSARANALINSASPELGQTFAQAYADRQRPKMQQAASDFIRISELLGDPSVTPEDSARMMQQWDQTYGTSIRAKPQAISPEQAAELRDALQLQQISSEAGGVPIVRDAKGQPIVNPGWEARHKVEIEQQRILAEQQAAQRAMIENRFRARMAALRGIKPQAGSSTYEADNAAYQGAIVSATNEYMSALDSVGQSAPAAGPVVSPPPVPAPEVAPEIANRSGLPLVDDQDDFDALPSGAEFIDKADGKKYRKP